MAFTHMVYSFHNSRQSTEEDRLTHGRQFPRLNYFPEKLPQFHTTKIRTGIRYEVFLYETTDRAGLRLWSALLALIDEGLERCYCAIDNCDFGFGHIT